MIGSITVIGMRDPSDHFAEPRSPFATALPRVTTQGEASLVARLNAWFPCRAGYADSEPGDIVEFNNIIKTDGPPPVSTDPNDPPPPEVPVCETRGTAFDPTAVYAYAADPAEDVPELVMTYAGAGKL